MQQHDTVEFVACSNISFGIRTLPMCPKLGLYGRCAKDWRLISWQCGELLVRAAHQVMLQLGGLGIAQAMAKCNKSPKFIFFATTVIPSTHQECNTVL